MEKDRDKGQQERRSKRGEVRYVTAHNVWGDKPLPSRHDSYEEQRKQEQDQED